MERERALLDLDRLRGGLVVSCQAREDNPLHGSQFMAAMAKSAVLGGAVGIRADGVSDVVAIREAIGPDMPILGIFKVKQSDGTVFITPSVASALNVIQAGAAGRIGWHDTPEARWRFFRRGHRGNQAGWRSRAG